MLRFDLPSVDSTSDAARRLAAEHPGEVLLVTARTQTAGRGRSGRPWASPPGGAWFSLALPLGAAPTRLTAAPLIVGVAVLSELRGLIGQRGRAAALSLKWPNDVLLGGAKVAGVLCEQDVLGDRPGPLFVGVGINANVRVGELGGGLRYPAASLLEATGRAVDIAALIGLCAARIVADLQRLAREGLGEADRLAIEESLAWRGRRVCLLRGGRRETGVLLGVDAGGRLLLEHGPGRRSHHTAGEISGLEPTTPADGPGAFEGQDRVQP